MKISIRALPFIAAALMGGAITSGAQSTADLAVAGVNGVQLSYLERGGGEPIVFIHGGLADYREWDPVARELKDEYRTITYSRRYNFPNDNAIASREHSAIVEAEDLAAFNRKLGLGPMHLVGVSYGAYTALLLALREPAMVRSITLVEPPLIRWLADLPGGAALFEDFYERTWRLAGEAFRRGDPNQALRVTLDYFVGPGSVDRIPPRMRALLMGNMREWEALTTSRDAFPAVSREEVRALPMPVLMLSGAKTYPMMKLIDAELEHNLADGQREIIAEGTHDVCSEKPAACAKAIRGFLDYTAIVDLEKRSWAAWQRHDGEFFASFLSDDHVDVGPRGIVGKAAIVAGVASGACKVRSYSTGKVRFTRIADGTAVLNYRAEQNTSCGGFPVPSPAWASSLYVKRGARWVNVLYQQTPATP